MERVALSAHDCCISFAATLTMETPLTRKKAHAVKEVSRPCDVSHMSAWKVCSHDQPTFGAHFLYWDGMCGGCRRCPVRFESSSHNAGVSRWASQIVKQQGLLI